MQTYKHKDTNGTGKEGGREREREREKPGFPKNDDLLKRFAFHIAQHQIVFLVHALLC